MLTWSFISAETYLESTCLSKLRFIYTDGSWKDVDPGYDHQRTALCSHTFGRWHEDTVYHDKRVGPAIHDPRSVAAGESGGQMTKELTSPFGSSPFGSVPTHGTTTKTILGIPRGCGERRVRIERTWNRPYLFRSSARRVARCGETPSGSRRTLCGRATRVWPRLAGRCAGPPRW